jgi:hypothetical protein
MKNSIQEQTTLLFNSFVAIKRKNAVKNTKPKAVTAVDALKSKTFSQNLALI